MNIVSKCSICVSEKEFCRLHQMREKIRYETIINENYVMVTKEEIDNWIVKGMVSE